MKVAIFFDIFAERGGAENIVILLAKHLNADIYTTFVDWKNTDEELKKLKIHQIGLILKNLKILTYNEIALRFKELDVSDFYDVFLFSRTYCFSAAIKHHPNIWISTGILEALYKNFTYSKLNFWQKPIFQIWRTLYKSFDQNWTKNFDKILANSKFTAEEINKIYEREVKVVNHPIETNRFHCKSYENFYLVVSRLVKFKRIDLIIEAFKEMPDKTLIVVGDGPEKEALKNLVKTCKNIKLLGSISNDNLIDLYSRCAATLSMGFNEPFGLIPIESMSSGKPCIASNEGGYLDTILHGRTGFLIKPTKEEIKKYVKNLTPDLAKTMKKDCIKRAKEFDVKVFIKRVREEIKELVI